MSLVDGRRSSEMGKWRWLASANLHGAVATQVAWKRASAFSVFVEHELPSGVMILLTSDDGFLPEAILLARKRLVWSTPERNRLQEFSFSWSIAPLKAFQAFL